MNINDVAHPKIPAPATDFSRAAGAANRNGSTAESKFEPSLNSKLIDRLASALNDKRTELLGDIREKFQKGDFHTRVAAESVADSILGR